MPRPSSINTITPVLARRLAITKQRLAGPRPAPGPQGLLMDRARGRLRVNAVYAEPSAPADRAAGQAVRAAIEELAAFLDATAIDYDSRRLPKAWKHKLSA